MEASHMSESILGIMSILKETHPLWSEWTG